MTKTKGERLIRKLHNCLADIYVCIDAINDNETSRLLREFETFQRDVTRAEIVVENIRK